LQERKKTWKNPGCQRIGVLSILIEELKQQSKMDSKSMKEVWKSILTLNL